MTGPGGESAAARPVVAIQIWRYAGMVPMTDHDKYTYSAFISYRHVEPDQMIAKRIQHSIETFKIPAVYRKDVSRKRFRKAFRDSDELSLDKDLASGIDYALEQSEFLIVILSPRYKESKWCLHEIDEFLKTHDRKNILCVLADGEPTDVLPESLTQVRSEENPEETVYMEPLCADYRLERSIAERLELPRLLSSMLSCDYDGLMKRQEVYRRNRFLKIGAAVLAALTVIIALQLQNTFSLNRSYKETLYSQSQTLAAQSLQRLEEFSREEALSLALKALPANGEKDDTPVTAEALHALSKATYLYQPYALSLLKSRSMQNEIVMRQISDDKSLIATMDSSAWILVQTASGKRLSYWQIDGVDTQYFGFLLQGSDNVLAWRGNKFYSYDYLSFGRNWYVRVPGREDSAGVLSAELIGDSACSVMTQSGIVLLDLRDGKVIGQLTSDAIEDAYRERHPASSGESPRPAIHFYKQLVCENGDILLSGCLDPSPEDGTEEELLWLSKWNPETNAFAIRGYDLPPHCLQMKAAGDESLVAVTSEEEFNAAKIQFLAGNPDEARFSRLDVLCFDIETLELQWEYAPEGTQPIALPRITDLQADEDTLPPLVSVTFDVDDYLFEAETGRIYFSLTLPEGIVLSRVTDEKQLSYYCNNHKLYTVHLAQKSVSETDGLSPFPDTVQAVDAIGQNIVAFSENNIYWFRFEQGPPHSGELRLSSEEDDLEYFDAGDNLLGAYSNRKLFLTDLKSGQVTREISLLEAPGGEGTVGSEGSESTESIEGGEGSVGSEGSESSEGTCDWKHAGNLPDGAGFLMLSKEEATGHVRLYTYDMKKDEFRLSGSLLEEAAFSVDAYWADSFVSHNGIVYAASPHESDSLLYYDAVRGERGTIPLTGIPASMILAKAYNDHVSEYELNAPTLTISPDGNKIFSTLCSTTTMERSFIVIDLRTGECTPLKTEDGHPGRTNVAAFSEDGRSLACSTDYAILLYDEGYSDPLSLSISGLNVRSMTWFLDDLWVKFSNNMVRRYDKNGEILSEITLDNKKVPDNAQRPEWTVVPTYYQQAALMLYDEGNMNLLSMDAQATTPILHIPEFVSWNNESDSFVVRVRRLEESGAVEGGATHVFYIYPHYTTEQILEIGDSQLREMMADLE